jgi:hypothetical protein
MIVKKIEINHTATILSLSKFIILFTDTITGIPNQITVINEGGPISASGWNSYFVTNALFDANLFTAQVTGSSSFTFQGKSANINITGYKGFTRILGVVYVETFEGFTFTITDVNVPEVAPIPPALPLDVRTAIDNESKVKLINSPLFIRETASISTKSVTVNLYIWDGLLNRVINQPTVILKKDKVSQLDNYISLPISDLIKPFIKPKFAYNRAAPAAITNQGVFIQAQIITINFDGTQTSRYTNTFFCTLGYRWNYEQNLIGDNGVQNYGASGFIVNVEKWFNSKIHNYFDQTFNFTRTVAEATTANVINYVPLTPTKLRCTLDPCLLVFIDKRGLWDTFTPHGKKTASVKVNRTISNISHRDPSQVDNTFTHSKQITSIDAEQSYVINTGSLDENMTSIIEELIYSPIVYLINFKGDLELVTTVGITIDNAIVSIDNTNISIDSQSITAEAIGFFKTHQQIPVVITDEDFTRKTRLNDRISIDYNLKFEETNNKINNIR